MTLVKAYLDGAASPEDISTHNSESVKQLLRYGTLCCDGSVVFDGPQAVSYTHLDVYKRQTLINQ